MHNVFDDNAIDWNYNFGNKQKLKIKFASCGGTERREAKMQKADNLSAILPKLEN